jgi:hypothetical protein
MRDSRNGDSMDRTYDIFVAFPDGSVVWRGSVIGHEAGVLQLKTLAGATKNEIRLVHLPDKTLIAALNVQAQQTHNARNAARLWEPV